LHSSRKRPGSELALDQTSVISSHYLKAKKIYRLKKLFNSRRLKPEFDKFVIKIFQNYKRAYRILRSNH